MNGPCFLKNVCSDRSKFQGYTGLYGDGRQVEDFLVLLQLHYLRGRNFRDLASVDAQEILHKRIFEIMQKNLIKKPIHNRECI